MLNGTNHTNFQQIDHHKSSVSVISSNKRLILPKIENKVKRVKLSRKSDTAFEFSNAVIFSGKNKPSNI